MPCDSIENKIVHQEVKEILCKLKHINAHKETNIASHPNYKGAWRNVMVEWEIWETTTERLYITTGYDPLICALYTDERIVFTVSSTIMLISIGVTLNYTSMKYGKALIYASFNQSKNENFGDLSYGVLALEHTKFHIQIYKKSKHYIMDLLYLDSTRDNDKEKW